MLVIAPNTLHIITNIKLAFGIPCPILDEFFPRENKSTPDFWTSTAALSHCLKPIISVVGIVISHVWFNLQSS